jgi:hypothetical protein
MVRNAPDQATLDWSAPELAVVDFGAELRKRREGEAAARRAVEEWKTCVPGGRLVDDASGQVYRLYHVEASPEDAPHTVRRGAPDPVAPWGLSDFQEGASPTLWRCAIVGPRVSTPPNNAIRRFTPLAYEALRDVIRGPGQGINPESSWLIHLADREEPLRPPGRYDPLIQPPARRQFVRWSEAKGPRPHWIPAIQAGRLASDWWAVRFENVFLYSALTVRQVIEVAGCAAGARAGGDSTTSTIEPDKSYAKGKRINERMLAEINKRPTESFERSLRDWAELFDCSPSTVKNTKAWKTLHQMREGAKLARQMKDKEKRTGRG